MNINGLDLIVGEKYLVGNLHGPLDMKMAEGTLLLATVRTAKEAIEGHNAYVELEVEGLDEIVELWFGKTDYYAVEGWHGVEDLRIDPNDSGATIMKAFVFINEGLSVGDRFRLQFTDSNMSWLVEIIEPNMTLVTKEWFGREAETLIERDENGDLHPIIFKIVERDVTKVKEDWVESPEVNESPVWNEEHALCFRTKAGWLVEFGEFSSIVISEQL